MKTQKNSFFWLLSRLSLPWVGGCSVFLLIAQGIYAIYQGSRLQTEVVPFAQWLEAPFYGYCFALAFLTMYCSMTISSTPSRYTYLRLGLSTKEMFVLVFVNSFCSLLVIWAVQALLYLGMGLYYCSVIPEGTGNLQVIFLDSFRSASFHTVVPSYDLFQWLNSLSGIFLMASVSASQFHRCILEQKTWFCYSSLIVSMVALRNPATAWEVNVFFLVVQVILSGILWKGGMKHEDAY